jgi:NAD(P)-dependent dehydrogenase (short-subunit alcohol dehydrogenase family)
LRFDDRVAVITGAGRGLGREYALLLASRGAKVVVNNRSGDAARAVVKEITGAGGVAVPCETDVQTRPGAEAPVKAALDQFGHVDIVVNNAGIVTFHPFADFPDEEFDQIMKINVRGAWLTSQTAWPHMIEQGYGRIVMIGSRVMLGMPNNAAYSTSRGAMLGLSNSLAAEGRPHGIHVNTLSVAGYTDGVKQILPDLGFQKWMAENMPPWAAARSLAWLVHEDCPASGQFFSAFGRGFSRLFLAETRGHVSASFEAHTPEAIRNDFDALYDEEGYVVAPDNKASAEFASARLGAGSIGDYDRAVGKS